MQPLRNIWNYLRTHPVAMIVAAVVGIVVIYWAYQRYKSQQASTQTSANPKSGQGYTIINEYYQASPQGNKPGHPIPIPHPPIGPMPPIQNKPPATSNLNTYTLLSPKQIDMNTTFGPNSVLTWQGFAQGEYQDEYKYQLKSSWSPTQIANFIPGVQVQQ